MIKSEKEWEKLQGTSITGKILVPFFYSNRIAAVPNNTNIFVYGEDEPCYIREKLELRKRTRRNIVISLEYIGIDSNDAYNMVENTHGLYVPLKKKLFSGAMHDRPDWVNTHSDVIMAALLCGKWTESTGDVLIFEELAVKPYSECKKELEHYLHRENPYIVSCESRRGESVQLASVEDAWEELDIYITEELWDKFINLFYEVLIESEPIFEYPFDKHFEASIYAEKPVWSRILKQGIIRTLIMHAYYRGHAYEKTIQNEVLDKLILNCSSMDDLQKMEIKNWIRYKIYRNRYHASAEWSMPEEILQQYEELLNKIIITDKVYDYIYIFTPEYEFPLLHPVPFCEEEKSNLRRENQLLKENEINARIREFKENGYSLEKLINLAVKVKQSTVGDVLARFYCEGVFDENIFRLLIENEEEGRCAYNYVRCLYSGEGVLLNEVIDLVRSMPGKENLLVKLLSLEVIEDYEKACIIGESEDIKKVYWSRNANFCISPKAERKGLIWALDECGKYGTLDAYLELLYDVKDKISGLELFDRVFAICDMRSDVPYSMTRYYLEEVLKELQDNLLKMMKDVVNLQNWNGCAEMR